MKVKSVHWIYDIHKQAWTYCIEHEMSASNDKQIIESFFKSNTCRIIDNNWKIRNYIASAVQVLTMTLSIKSENAKIPFYFRTSKRYSYITENPDILWMDDPNNTNCIMYMVDTNGKIATPNNKPVYQGAEFIRKRSDGYSEKIRTVFDPQKIKIKENGDAELIIEPVSNVMYNHFFKGRFNTMASYPEKMVFNGPMTVAIWGDGTKTYAKCADGDSYDPVIGALVCIIKHIYGKGSSNRIGKMMEIINQNYGQNFSIDFDNNNNPHKEN